MSYKIEFLASARKELADLPEKIQRQIMRRIAKLADEPRPKGCKALQGDSALYRIRSGDYRFIYRVEDARLLVTIVKIGPRATVYRRY